MLLLTEGIMNPDKQHIDSKLSLLGEPKISRDCGLCVISSSHRGITQHKVYHKFYRAKFSRAESSVHQCQIFLRKKLNSNTSDVHRHPGAKPPSPNPGPFHHSLILSEKAAPFVLQEPLQNHFHCRGQRQYPWRR